MRHEVGSNKFPKSSPQTINISFNDSSTSDANDVLIMDSYIILSSDIPLGKVQRAIIYENRLYVLDSQPKIVCFNRDGSIEFQIASKGRGPGEFIRIVDFSIDKNNNILIVYDSAKRKLINYSLTDGHFISEQIINIAPHAFASIDGSNYFYNPFSFNYPNSKEYHYSLLWGKNGDNINKKYLKHEPVVSNYIFDFENEFPFFYNKNQIYFINRFDEIVYSLKSDTIAPKYQIKLPNPVTISVLKDKQEPLNLLESEYSVGLSDIYQSKNILYFKFTNRKYYYFTFYDLEKQKILYCGRRVQPSPTKELPVYYPIRGVYKNKFFTLINPSIIIGLGKKHQQAFPLDLLKIKELDNPVLMFYRIKRSQL